jgi:hypothetical protein
MADQMQPTPRSTILGLFSDIVNLPLQYMSSPERTQQMQGTAQFLYDTGIPKTLERLSYGDSLFSGAGMTLRPREETINAAMNVAPFVKPAAVMANRAAMSAGRAGERLAERVVPQVMSRGGLGSQLLSDVSRGSVSPLDVYHGTPHKFAPTESNPLGEFKSTKIGSGEGSQAFGYGHYFAEEPTVAKQYQAMATNPARRQAGLTAEGRDQAVTDALIAMNAKQFTGGDVQKLADLIDRRPAAFSNPEMMKARISEYVDNNPPSYLYKVDLPDEKIATMLDWDKPLSQQSPQVKEALKGIENDLPSIPDFDLKKWMDADPLASTWHNVLARDLQVEPSKISELLANKGVAGIKYLDEMSRGSGKGTRNFVVFPNEEKSMTILERNGVRAFPEPPVEQSINDFSYRGSHTAPSSEFGAPLYDLTGGGQMYPADVYSAKAAQYYGSGNIRADIEAFNLAKQVRGNPDAEVTIYRAVPKNADISNINAGDWVTLTKDYAKGHGEAVLGNDYKILSQKVKAKELWTNADSIQEFGYQPESLTQQAATPIENPTFTDPFGNTIGSSIR